MTSPVLICDSLDPVALEVFRGRGIEPRVRTGLTEDELVESLAGVRALVVRSATRITRRVLESAPDLEVVGRAGIGVDNVDCDAATERGVLVMNTPTGNATTTAEHALALLFSLARHVPRADRLVRAGGWKRKKELLGTELTGKTLGVVGLGRIGRIVADRALGLRMSVVAHDPYFPPGAEAPVAGVELATLDDLLGRADFVTLHVPLNDATRNLISWERLARIRPGARIINASRGGVVDEEAVLDALREGRLAGAAFDVLAEEPPAADHPLFARDDVVLTPHLGASSAEAQHRVAADIAEAISNYLLDGVAESAVNAPAMPVEVLRELAPFLQLVETCGSFLAQRLGEPIRKLELTLSGEIAGIGHSQGQLGLALLVGVLRQTSTSDGSVNFVNAKRLAEERGIRLLSNKVEAGDYRHGAIKVRASTRGGTHSHVVSGAVFGRSPRIVRVDGVHLDLPPSGPLLLTRHADEPGVVGKLGTVLGRHGINIRRVELGPAGENGDGLASGFLSLYEVPGPEVVEEIAALEPVREVQLLRL